jgi:hypothetical protein
MYADDSRSRTMFDFGYFGSDTVSWTYVCYERLSVYAIIEEDKAKTH